MFIICVYLQALNNLKSMLMITDEDIAPKHRLLFGCVKL